MQILEADIKCLAVRPGQYPPENMPEIAFAGRSNVGKSTLLNLLTNRKNLARTSGSPGKTRTINFFDIKAKRSNLVSERHEEGQIASRKKATVSFRIVDLPGYGYAKVSRKITDDWGTMMETFLSSRKNLKKVVQLVDSRHKPTQQDVQMYEYLKYYGLSGIVVATKSDKCKKSELKKNIDIIRSELGCDKDDILIPVSALKRTGQDELLNVIDEMIR